MPLIQDLIKKATGKEEEEEYVPKEVIDRQLDALRRQRQVQMNQEEKIRLKKEISEYNHEQMSHGLFGRVEKEKHYIKEMGKKQKQENLLKQKSMLKKEILMKKQEKLLSRKSLLNNKKDEFKKTKTQSFLGKSML